MQKCERNVANYFSVCESKPGAAGLRDSPALPRLERTVLYYSSLQQLSWRLESYPGWKKNRETGSRHNTKVNKHFYHLTDRTFTHNFQLKHHVSYLSSCDGVDISSVSLWWPWQKRLLSISFSLCAIGSIITAVSNLTLFSLLPSWWWTKSSFLLRMFSVLCNWEGVCIWLCERGAIYCGAWKTNVQKHLLRR